MVSINGGDNSVGCICLSIGSALDIMIRVCFENGTIDVAATQLQMDFCSCASPIF